MRLQSYITERGNICLRQKAPPCVLNQQYDASLQLGDHISQIFPSPESLPLSPPLKVVLLRLTDHIAAHHIAVILYGATSKPGGEKKKKQFAAAIKPTRHHSKT